MLQVVSRTLERVCPDVIVRRLLRYRRYPRNSLDGILRQAYNIGLRPSTVLDVGAAYGSFTQQCYNFFPEARYILIEPLEEYRNALEEVITKIPQSEYLLAASASKTGEVTINVHPDLVGSSFYLESEDSSVNGMPRTVPLVTLDNVCQSIKTTKPYLIKIDVQGAELNVLDGAVRVLGEAQFVILEVSFFKFFNGGPLFHEAVRYMKSKDFVVYDVFNLQYRPLDNALSQADVVFVPEDGLFRRYHFYATREQREQQTRILQSGRKQRK